MATIAEVVAAGKEFGIFDFYLPFIIMFAIIFGVLMKTQIFGDPSKQKGVKGLNVILAGAISLFVMIYTPVGVTLAQFLSTLFAETLIVIVTLLAIMLVVFLVMPMLGVKFDETGKKRAGGVVIALIILIGVGVFISSGGLAFFPGITFGTIPAIPTVLLPGLTSQDLALIVLGLLTLFVFWWLVRSGGSGEHTARAGS